ncbi:MAG: carboxypeptidase regulatory-like domain-containing protein [Planctomycetes bacterium]|nr:carboxypeptidase regulatory-like domain-containing protein [Planctomycetota bacterium]
MQRSLTILALLALVGVLALAWFGSGPSELAGAPELDGVDAANVAEPQGELAPSIASTSGDPHEALEDLALHGELTEIQAAPQPAQRKQTRLTGRLVDSAGVALVGARVYAANRDRGPDLPLDAELWGERNSGRRVVTSDAQGNFVVSDLAPGPVRLAVRAPNCAPYDGDHFFVAPETDTDAGEIVLALGVRLAGRVLDARGAPVEGALIVLPFVTTDPSWRWRAANTGNILGTSSANGAFDVGPLAVGPWTLLVHHERYPDLALRGTTQTPGERVEGLEARLLESATITGRVRVAAGAGSPAAERFGVLATYSGETAREPGVPDFSRRSARCESDGSFELTGLLADEPYRLRVRWYRNADDERGTEIGPEVDALAGDRNLELEVAPFAVVLYRPVDSLSGAALEDLDGRLVVDGPDGRSRGLASTTSTAGGGVWRETSAESPAAGELATVQVTHPAYRPAKSNPFAYVVGAEHDAGEVRLEALGRVDVRVISAESGEPIRGARITVVLTSGDDGTALAGTPARGDRVRVRSRDTDAAGRASVYASPGATGVACVTHDEWPSSELREVTFVPDPGEPTEFALEAGATLEVSVTDGVLPVAGVDVRARFAAPRETLNGDLRNVSRSQRTDSAGRARFENLTPGATVVQLSEERIGSARTPDERAAATANVDLVPGSVTQVSLVVTPRGELSGRVLEGRVPLAGAAVELRAGNARDVERRRGERGPDVLVHSDAAGRYSIPRLGAGRWTITVTHASRLVPFVKEFEFDGRDETLDLALPAAVVAGRVFDSKGRAIEGARVALGRLRPDERNREQKNWTPVATNAVVRSDAAGAFELRGVPVGVELQLSVEHPQFQQGRSSAFTLQYDEFRGDLDVRLKLGATIEALVLGSDGRGPRVRVTARRIADEKGKAVKSGERAATTNAKGLARFTGLPAGRYRVVVQRRFGSDELPTHTVEAKAGDVARARFDVP